MDLDLGTDVYKPTTLTLVKSNQYGFRLNNSHTYISIFFKMLNLTNMDLDRYEDCPYIAIIIS